MIYIGITLIVLVTLFGLALYGILDKINKNLIALKEQEKTINITVQEKQNLDIVGLN